MTSIELIVGIGVDQRRIEIRLPGVPSIGDFVYDRGGDVELGTVYAVLWHADAEHVQVRVK
jgi:hypothetical protein